MMYVCVYIQTLRKEDIITQTKKWKQRLIPELEKWEGLEQR